MWEMVIGLMENLQAFFPAEAGWWRVVVVPGMQRFASVPSYRAQGYPYLLLFPILEITDWLLGFLLGWGSGPLVG